MVKKIYTPELFEDIKRRYKRVLSGEAFTIEEEKIKKGERVITETSYNPVIHEGKVIGACMFAKDVTSRKRLEKELFHSQRIESLGTLAGGIAHEINNILTPVSMLVKEIKTSDPESLEIKEIISLNASRGTELARQVLGFASPEIGRPEIIEISALIGSLEKIIKRTFPRNILLKIKNNLTGEAFTEGNKTLLNQALLNICLNARDAMPEGGSLTIQYMVTEDKNLEIKVIDQGTGIAPEIINKIFDPFFSTKEPGSGTGLGLSTVMTVIKKHNGSVKVKSESGKGTVFIILLPLYQREVIQSKNHENTAFIPTRGEEILVIDDERIIAMSVRKILEKEGYKVFTAYNGKEGLEIYRNNQDRIKLVLLDMSMPVMSGFETYNQLRNLNPGLKIIINTGLPDEVSMLNNKDIDIILKPYETELLLGKVTMMLKA